MLFYNVTEDHRNSMNKQSKIIDFLTLFWRIMVEIQNIVFKPLDRVSSICVNLFLSNH